MAASVDTRFVLVKVYGTITRALEDGEQQRDRRLIDSYAAAIGPDNSSYMPLLLGEDVKDVEFEISEIR